MERTKAPLCIIRDRPSCLFALPLALRSLRLGQLLDFKMGLEDAKGVLLTPLCGQQHHGIYSLSPVG